jgi:hypothetical protein
VVVTAGIAAAILLGGSGCSGGPAPSISPLVVKAADIQSGTVRVRLNQVVRITTSGLTDHYTPLVADESVVTVVVRRDDRTGRFEPELVPHRVGSTQVALLSPDPLDTIGFHVIVSEAAPHDP